MVVMAKQTNTPSTKGKRSGRALNVWLPEDLLDALDKYVEESRPQTSAKAVVKVALEDFLTKEGRWPPS